MRWPGLPVGYEAPTEQSTGVKGIEAYAQAPEATLPSVVFTVFIWLLITETVAVGVHWFSKRRAQAESPHWVFAKLANLTADFPVKILATTVLLSSKTLAASTMQMVVLFDSTGLSSGGGNYALAVLVLLLVVLPLPPLIAYLSRLHREGSLVGRTGPWADRLGLAGIIERQHEDIRHELWWWPAFLASRDLLFAVLLGAFASAPVLQATAALFTQAAWVIATMRYKPYKLGGQQALKLFLEVRSPPLTRTRALARAGLAKRQLTHRMCCVWTAVHYACDPVLRVLDHPRSRS